MEKLSCFDCMFMQHDEGTYYCVQSQFKLISDEYGEEGCSKACLNFTREKVYVNLISEEPLPF